MHYVLACVRPKEGQKAAVDYSQVLVCWLSPAILGSVPTPLLCWTFSAHSSPSPLECWLDLRHIVAPDDTQFDDIEFACWESDAPLLRGCDTEDGRWK